MAVLTGAFLRFKLSRVLRHTNGRDGSPIKNDYSFLINRNWGGLDTLLANVFINIELLNYRK